MALRARKLSVSIVLCGANSRPEGPHDIDALGAAVADGVTWRAAFECQLVDESHALLPYDLHTPIYIVIAACMSIQNIATAQTTNPKAASLNTKPNIRGRRRNIAPPRTHVTATT